MRENPLGPIHPPPRIDAHHDGIYLHQQAVAAVLDFMALVVVGLVALAAIHLSRVATCK